MKVQDGQNIFDITLQTFGTLEELLNLIINNNLNLNFELKSGQELTVKTEKKGNEIIKDFVILKNITYNNNQNLKLTDILKFKGGCPVHGGDYNIDFGNDYY